MNAVFAPNPDFSGQLGDLIFLAEGATSLTLLNKIDETVDSLASEQRLYEGIVATARRLASAIAHDSTSLLDPDDRAITALREIYRSMEAELPKILQQRQSVDDDPQLSESHCDMLNASFDMTIKAMAKLIEALKDLAAAVIAHDLALESRDESVYESVSDLIASCR